MKITEMLAFFQIPSQSNPSLKEKNPSVHSFILLLSRVAVLMHGNLLHVTVKIGVLILKVYILINHTVQWKMLTNSESTLILHLCIYSLPVFYMLVMHFRINIFPFMKEFVSVRHLIISNCLKYLIPMFL